MNTTVAHPSTSRYPLLAPNSKFHAKKSHFRAASLNLGFGNMNIDYFRRRSRTVKPRNHN
jgi:hypothetical protein